MAAAAPITTVTAIRTHLHILYFTQMPVPKLELSDRGEFGLHVREGNAEGESAYVCEIRRRVWQKREGVLACIG